MLNVNYPDFSDAHMKSPVMSVSLTDEGGVLLYKHCITAVGRVYACWRNTQQKRCGLKGETSLQKL